VSYEAIPTAFVCAVQSKGSSPRLIGVVSDTAVCEVFVRTPLLLIPDQDHGGKQIAGAFVRIASYGDS
jgi:hypothetical protein